MNEPQNFDLFGNVVEQDVLLRDRFMEPPFSVLNSMNGKWQARKKAWMAKGIKSEVGRHTDVNAAFDDEIGSNGLNKYGRKPLPTTSIFDPALCELLYNWFCPKGGSILDPFAGGSVRGIVANYMGFKYTGIDIRQEQIDSNREQALDILPVNNQPQWYVGDSNEVLNDFNKKFDLILSCPPYADLEVYSDIEGDISNMDYSSFMQAYREINKKAVGLLKPGGFAVYVVGDIRDKKGNYVDFVSHSKQSFIDAGVFLYNEAVMLQPLGTAMLRAPRIFDASKKLTKVHENILIFKK